MDRDVSLERNAERFDRALEGAGVGVFEADLEKRTAHRSPELIRMLGGDPATFPSAIDVMETRMHPEDLVQRRKDIAALHDVGRLRSEYRVRHEDGHWMWLEVRWTVTARDSVGRVARIAGVVADITGLKTAERKLRESEAAFRTVIEHASDAIHLYDLQLGRITVMNPRYVELTGYSEDEMRAMPFAQAEAGLHPDDRTRVVEHLRAMLAASPGPPTPLEYRWTTKRGEVRWIRSVRTVVRDESGTAVAFVGVSHDITDRKEAEAAIRAALAADQALIQSLRERLEANTLGDMLPVCMYCKRIRDDAGAWIGLDQYITEHTESVVSHALCPSCADKFLSDDDGAPPAEG